MNYCKQIAEMLGIELGEEFSLKDNKTKNIVRTRYKITQEEGIMYSMDGEKWRRSAILLSIVNGSYSVVRLPWKPKKDERYWWYSYAGRAACSTNWKGSYSDLTDWKVGNCFKTKEEAEAKENEILEALQKEFEEA